MKYDVTESANGIQFLRAITEKQAEGWKLDSWQVNHSTGLIVALYTKAE